MDGGHENRESIPLQLRRMQEIFWLEAKLRESDGEFGMTLMHLFFILLSPEGNMDMELEAAGPDWVNPHFRRILAHAEPLIARCKSTPSLNLPFLAALMDSNGAGTRMPVLWLAVWHPSWTRRSAATTSSDWEFKKIWKRRKLLQVSSTKSTLRYPTRSRKRIPNRSAGAKSRGRLYVLLIQANIMVSD